jgi:hypothetical protein
MIYVTSKWLLSASVVSLAFTFGNSMQHCANVITDCNIFQLRSTDPLCLWMTRQKCLLFANLKRLPGSKSMITLDCHSGLRKDRFML